LTSSQKKLLDVGQDAAASSARFDEELEIHIEDCHWQYRTAYERFQMHGNPNDRDEALLHLHRMNAAILARSPAAQAARWAEIQQSIDDGVGYFAFRGEQDRVAMEARG
jgi:hypothetical protein